ncbi:MAG: hypothetical protein SFT68_05920, partial [Rickettsiaceae bacterium]|nr:hypothetical protein [Rickettsiaceae bacterium]
LKATAANNQPSNKSLQPPKQLKHKNIWHVKITEEQIEWYGLTPWHIAAIKGDVELILALENTTQNGSTINTKDKEGRSPLDLALNNFQDQVGAALIRTGISIDDPESLIDFITWNEYPAIYIALLEKRPVLTNKLELFKNALYNDKFFIAKAIISYGEEIPGESLKANLSDIVLLRTLKACCQEPRLDGLYFGLVGLLKEQKLWNEINELKTIALEYKNISVLEDLYANEDLYNPDGIHILVSKIDETTQKLSQIYKSVGWDISIREALFGIDINQFDSSGSTVLYKLTVQSILDNKDKLEYLDYVLQCGANINLTQRADGKTPLHAAVTAQDLGILLKLIAKADIDSFRTLNSSGLDLASIANDEENAHFAEIIQATYQNLSPNEQNITYENTINPGNASIEESYGLASEYDTQLELSGQTL